MTIEIIFVILILILSVVIHEVSHGYAANMLGDPTARIAGRLTLNPIKHLDLMGSIIIPGLLVLSGSPFLFGYAKPVPYNPYNLRKYSWAQKWGEAIVALAGPSSNIFIALSFGLFVRVGLFFEVVTPAFVEISTVVVFINILLAIINMIPIPPLDGSKVLSAILPFSLSGHYARLRITLENNIFLAFGLIVLFIYFFAGAFSQFILKISSFIVGF
jgi:Zn-dependent protease